MKTKNKALLLSLCAVLLVAASVMGTIAYLSDTESVTNTFSFGSVTITLDEEDVDSDNNTADNVTLDGVIRDKANSYKLLPGHQYDKDPIVHVDVTSEDCYLFVIVNNEIAAIESDAAGDKTVAAQIAENGWAKVGETADGSLYVYGTVEDPTAVQGGTDKTVFTTFKIDGDVTNTTLAGYAGETIVVTAYAVQMDGFENNTASEIWNTAFGTPALQ